MAISREELLSISNKICPTDRIQKILTKYYREYAFMEQPNLDSQLLKIDPMALKLAESLFSRTIFKFLTIIASDLSKLDILEIEKDLKRELKLEHYTPLPNDSY